MFVIVVEKWAISEVKCIHKDKVCHKCNKRGHISKVCKSSSVGTINVESEEILHIQGDNQGDCLHVQDEAHMSCNSEDLYTVSDVHSVSKKFQLRLETKLFTCSLTQDVHTP